MFDLTHDQIRTALSHIPAHDREVWVKIGNALKTELGAEGFCLFDDWSQTADSYKACDAKSVWKSLQVGKNHLGTIIHHAKLNGFDPAQIGDIKTLSPQEQADRSARLKTRQEQAAREEQEAAKAFIPLVADILEQCTAPMLPPPYAQSKRIGTHNLLTIEADRLQRFKAPDTKKSIGLGLTGALTVAPLETLDGELVALQVFDGIPDDKGKFARRYVGKPSVLAGYYRLGDWTAPTVIVITEGMADAVSCFEATGYPVLAAGSVGRLEQAAQAVKAKHPGALVAVVGDNDNHGKGQEAARSAAAAVAGVCVIPDGEGVKDANDLLRSNGQEAVKIMIDAAIESKKAAPPSEEDAAPETQTSGDSVAGGELAKLIGLVLEAIESAKGDNGDAGALFEDDVISALSAIYEQSKAEYARLRLSIKKLRTVSLSELEKLVKPQGGEADKEPGLIDLLVSLAKEKCRFFHDPDLEPYAVFEAGGHSECWHLQSKSFGEWLSYQLYQIEGTAPSDTLLKAAIASLTGMAKFEGEEKPVYIRTATHDGAYWLDLCNEQWQAVRITADGWQVIDNPPVMFTRSSPMRPLSMPQHGGDFAVLWEVANIPETDRLTVLAWLLECLRPDTPYVVLELTGEQGSAKTSTQEALRDLIDPNQANCRAAPKAVEDVWVMARNSHMVSFENLSHLSASYQDALCMLATGGGYATRTLFTTADETVLNLKKPVVLNGIAVIVTAQDLLDRTLHIDLPTITHRIRASELKTRFDTEKGRIFGALLTLFSQVLKVLPSIELEPQDLPRMADFAFLGEAVYRVNGHPPMAFLSAYNAKRKDGIYRTIEASPVASAMLAYLEEYQHGYEGTAKRLREKLEAYKQDNDGWPKSDKGFGDALRRLAPAMRTIGFDVDYLGHKRDGHHWKIKPIYPSGRSAGQNNGHNGHNSHTPPERSTKNSQNHNKMTDSVTNVTIVTVNPLSSPPENIYKPFVEGEV